MDMQMRKFHEMAGDRVFKEGKGKIRFDKVRKKTDDLIKS